MRSMPVRSQTDQGLFGQVANWFRRRKISSETTYEAVLPVEEVSTWTELSIAADTAQQDRLLIEVIGPFVRSKDNAGNSRSVVFLRDKINQVPRLRIWIDQPAQNELEDLLLAAKAVVTGNEKQSEINVRAGVSPHFDQDSFSGTIATSFFTDLLSDATPLLLEQIEAVAEKRASRMAVALDLMIAHLPAIDIARIFPDRYPYAQRDTDVPAGFPVYRSHADGFFVLSKDAAQTRAQFDAQYESRRAALHERITAVLSQFKGGDVVSEVGNQWNEIAGRYLLRADEAIRSGGLKVKWDTGYIGDGHSLAGSLFHRIVQRAPGLRSFLSLDPGYLAARTMMSGLYLVINNLGLRLVDRVFLCHAISRSCEELFHVEATSIIRNLARFFASGRAARQV
ncbi:MAG TPA: lantibiotic dehydratase C-terminal domain-containing protein [Pyrinomonadaceae bacterium]|nr:lantibiotic dehydratase C-terminal domain-containing protein [Pyrinomonadaceae bacterium]